MPDTPVTGLTAILSGAVVPANDVLYLVSVASGVGFKSKKITVNELFTAMMGVLGVSPTEFSYLANVTSDIQAQLAAKLTSASGLTSLTGDVTTSGFGAAAATIAANAVTTGKIADANVTLAKLAAQAATTILANATGGSAGPTAVGLGYGLGFAAGLLKTVPPTPVVLTPGTTVAVDATLRGPYQLTPGQNFTLSNPTGAVDEQVMHFHFIQPGAGGPFAITLDTKFVIASDIGTVVLPTGAGKRARMTVIRYAATDKFDVVAFTKEF